MVPSKQLIFHWCLPQFWLINAQIYPYSCRRYQHICCILFSFCFNVISIHYHTRKQKQKNLSEIKNWLNNIYKIEFKSWKTSVCPMKGNIWILKSWKFFACKLCNPESYALDSSIQLKEFLLVIGIQNPSSTDKESRIQFLESRATTDSRIQDRLGLPHMRRWFPSPGGGGGGPGGYSVIYRVCTLFWKKIQVLYISHFSRTPSVQKSAWSLCIC